MYQVSRDEEKEEEEEEEVQRYREVGKVHVQLDEQADR